MNDFMQLNPGYRDPSSDYAACLHAAGGSRVRALELYAELLESAVARVRAAVEHEGEIAVVSMGEPGFHPVGFSDPQDALHRAIEAVGVLTEEDASVMCVAPLVAEVLAVAFSRLEVVLGQRVGWVFMGYREHAAMRVFRDVLTPELRHPLRERGVVGTLWEATVVVSREVPDDMVLVASNDGGTVVKVTMFR